MAAPKGPVLVPKSDADFSDPESQRVLTAAARAVAGELGRQAAREEFDRILATASRKVS